ncbi:hypothetical protein ACEPAF_8216 [Sanghuangporus sanghuang]
MSSQQLLKCAFPLIRSHGFTRQALSVAALSLPKPPEKPLSDTAIDALFGEGEEARRTLLNAWLAEGRKNMEQSQDRTISGLLKHRLRWNEPVLQYLPEAFAMMMTSSTILPLDVMHAIQHAGSIANQACYLSGDKSVANAWYAKRAALSAVYTAAELHQLSSPSTADGFLDDLLETSQNVESVVSDTAEFGKYVTRSWAGIYRSLGLN